MTDLPSVAESSLNGELKTKLQRTILDFWAALDGALQHTAASEQAILDEADQLADARRLQHAARQQEGTT